MSNRSVVALDSYSMFLREMNKAPVLSVAPKWLLGRGGCQV